MDWTAFWTGVGALATVATVIITVVVIIRGRSRVIVEYTTVPYDLPPTILPLFKCIQWAPYSLESLPDSPEKMPPAVIELVKQVKEIQKDQTLLQTLTSTSELWFFEIKNRGQEKVENLDLHIPKAIQSLIEYSYDSREMRSGGVIQIRELRPGEDIKVSTRTKLTYIHEKPKVYLPKGRAVLRYMDVVDIRLARIFYAPILIFCGVLLLILLIVSVRLW